MGTRTSPYKAYKLTKTQVNYIISQYKGEKKTVKQLSEHFKYPPEGVSDFLKASGIAVGSHRKSKLMVLDKITRPTLNEIRAVHAIGNGLSLPVIQKLYGVDDKQIRIAKQRVRAYGL